MFKWWVDEVMVVRKKVVRYKEERKQKYTRTTRHVGSDVLTQFTKWQYWCPDR